MRLDAGHGAGGQAAKQDKAGAKRVPAEQQLQADSELISEGWERRFIADARRAEEAMELYEQLGYEVRVEPAQGAELGDDCDDCQLMLLLQFKTIYTRKRRE